MPDRSLKGWFDGASETIVPIFLSGTLYFLLNVGKEEQIMSIKLQQTFEDYLSDYNAHARAISADADQVEACFELLAEYLLHFSDLFQDAEEFEEDSADEWEAALEAYIEGLMEGDTEQVPDLGGLPLDALDAEHIRDYLGWFLLRIPGMDSLNVEAFVEILQDWSQRLIEKKQLSAEQYADFVSVLNEMRVDAVRVSKAAHLLLHHVRMGGGISPRLRGKAFHQFVEGHARIVELKELGRGFAMWLDFDSALHDESIGPIRLPKEIYQLLAVGDVLDIELGCRGEQWMIVDIGPVYPASVYVEAGLFDVPQKMT